MIFEDPPTAVGIERQDDGSIVATFCAGATAADLATAFASLPADAWVVDTLHVLVQRAGGLRGQPTSW